MNSAVTSGHFCETGCEYKACDFVHALLSITTQTRKLILKPLVFSPISVRLDLFSLGYPVLREEALLKCQLALATGGDA